jgi:hypothetical protein
MFNCCSTKATFACLFKFHETSSLPQYSEESKHADEKRFLTRVLSKQGVVFIGNSKLHARLFTDDNIAYHGRPGMLQMQSQDR